LPSLSEIREGIAEALGAIDGIQASAYMLPNPTPPTIQVFPEEVDYDEAGARGLDMWTLTVQAFVGTAGELEAQKLLDAYLSPAGATSVKAAIETDPTLGGVIDDLRVTKASGYRIYRISNFEYLGCEWTVEVYAEGIT
jgi:hypothetical protein